MFRRSNLNLQDSSFQSGKINISLTTWGRVKKKRELSFEGWRSSRVRKNNKNDYRRVSSGHVPQFGDSLVITFLSA